MEGTGEKDTSSLYCGIGATKSFAPCITVCYNQYVATSAQIQAVISDCLENDVTFAELAAIVKRAIVNALISSSQTVVIPWNTMSSDSTSISQLTMDQASNLLDFCLKRANGGVVVSLAEFRNPV